MTYNLAITSWQIDGETMEIVTDFLFLGSKITADGDCSHEMRTQRVMKAKQVTKREKKMGCVYVYLQYWLMKCFCFIL